MPREVRIRYHYDPEGAWWADSPDLERWTAAGETFADVRMQAHEGASRFSGEQVMIVEEGVPEQVPASGQERAVVVTTGGAFGRSMIGASAVPNVRISVRAAAGGLRREGDLAADAELIGA